MKKRHQIVKIPVDQLIKADWNYKTDGTDEEIQKLANAILEANSAGVLAVREIKHPETGEWVFEVMDGNHRLDAIKRLDWKEADCENFGRISQAKAVIVTRQRNQNWFADDKLKLANLFSTVVFPEYDKDFIASVTTETVESLETLELLATARWQDPAPPSGSSQDIDGQQMRKVLITMPEETFNLWCKWKNRLKELAGITVESTAFEYAIIEGLNVPEEKWQK